MSSAAKLAGKRKTLKPTTEDESRWATRSAKTLQDKYEQMITNSDLNPNVVGVVDAVIDAVNGLRWVPIAPKSFDGWIDTLIHTINWHPQLDRYELFAKTALLFASKDIGHYHPGDALRSSRVNKTCLGLRSFSNQCVCLAVQCPRGFWFSLELTVNIITEFEQIHTGRPNYQFHDIFNELVAKYAGRGGLSSYNNEAVTETAMLVWNIHIDTSNPFQKAFSRECAAAAREAFRLELQRQWDVPTED